MIRSNSIPPRHDSLERMVSAAKPLPETPDLSKPARSGAACERSVQNRVSSKDATLVRLFCVYLFLQCFQYESLPMFRLHLGITMTPERLTFALILFAYVARLAQTSAYPGPGTI